MPALKFMQAPVPGIRRLRDRRKRLAATGRRSRDSTL